MRLFSLISALLAMVAAPLAAQIALPRVGVPDVGSVVDQIDDTLDRTTREIEREAQRLANDRLRRIDRLVRRNRDAIEFDANGAPARKGELLVMDASQSALEIARARGFTVLSRESVEGLDLELVRLSVPEAMELAEAQKQLEVAAPVTALSSTMMAAAVRSI